MVWLQDRKVPLHVSETKVPPSHSQTGSGNFLHVHVKSQWLNVNWWAKCVKWNVSSSWRLCLYEAAYEGQCYTRGNLVSIPGHVFTASAIRVASGNVSAWLVQSPWTQPSLGSRLDYCNSLSCGLLDKGIMRLQRLQNCSTHVVSRKLLMTPSLPPLKSLHWCLFISGLMLR